MGKGIVVADSGSTKTRWVVVRTDGSQEQLEGAGLNPHFTDDATYRHAFQEVARHCTETAAVYLYAAGCGTEAASSRVKALLSESFHTEHLFVEGDLLGACRSTCGCQAGLVGILGTGSNACRFNGTEIAAQVTSTGFILGDEGSGNHIGKRLLKGYLERTMPKHLSSMFHESYPLNNADFIDRLYRQPNPNRFLASLAPFAAQHRTDPYGAQLLAEVVDAFMRQQLLPLHPNGEPLHLVGSVAVAFRDEVEAAAHRHGLQIGMAVADPLPGLVQHHLTNF